MSMRMARIKNIPGELADDVETAMCRLSLEDTGTDRYDIPGLDRTAQILGHLDLEAQEGLDQISDEDEALSAGSDAMWWSPPTLYMNDTRLNGAAQAHRSRDPPDLAARRPDFKMRDLFAEICPAEQPRILQDELEIMQPFRVAESKRHKKKWYKLAMRLKTGACSPCHSVGLTIDWCLQQSCQFESRYSPPKEAGEFKPSPATDQYALEQEAAGIRRAIRHSNRRSYRVQRL